MKGTGMDFKDVTNAVRFEAFMDPLAKNKGAGYITWEGEPLCLFGRAFRKLGVRLPVSLNGYTVNELPWADIGISPPNEYQLLWASSVQVAADQGDSFILAVAKADATLV